jgi:hypothetical protein
MNISDMMRLVADSLDNADAKFREQVAENREAGLDSQAIMDAMITLGATGASMVMEMMSALPRPAGMCSCAKKCECQKDVTETASTHDIASEVERAASRMGLVQEDELAALRKRVIDLENQLNKSAK